MPTLEWLTRETDVRAAAHVPYRLLEADPSLSYGDEQTENMLIQGDNLDALKALLPFYAGRVKCIFIDPPYNTRSAFEHYDDNLEHSQWLGMMYPRLELLRELLTEDGTIWATIDDNESHYLKVIMDEVFGRRSFVANVIWEKADSPRNSARQFSSDHDHVMVFSKSAEWAPSRLPRTEKANSIYMNPDGDKRGLWLPGDPYANKPYSKGLFSIEGPTGRVFSPPPGRYWRVSEEKLKELDRDGRVWWGPSGAARPSIKRYLSEVSDLVPRTLWRKEEVGSNRTSKNEMRGLFPDEASFVTPKPEGLLKRVFQIATLPGDLVLDCFLGSGTTAAVAQKMDLRYIGVEMGEQAETHCVPRLKKVVDGEQGGISEEVGWKGGGGFRFFRLGSPIFDEQGQINPAIRFDHLAAHVWFAETRTPLSPKRKRSPFLGVHEETGYYLLFNGILGDKSIDGGNVLTHRLLAELPKHDGPRVIYGEGSRIGAPGLKKLGVVFKQIPYDVRAR